MENLTKDKKRDAVITSERAKELRMDLVNEIISLREEQGYNQVKLDKLSGVCQPTIYHIENGNTNPKLDTILKLLAPLGKTLYIDDIQ
ncbi:MAG: helix-turn-helix domain-containing protein [Firmicutes bacterium]|nr:helix-turn-helix domain-containing protein [Bacillota bacterium]